MSKITKFLEEYAKEIEEKTDKKITFRIGDYQGEYYNGDEEYIPIKGSLFLTTHNGNLFTVVDREQKIEDYFDVFSNDAIIDIDENNFNYIIAKKENKEEIVYQISIDQIKNDIETLNDDFKGFSGAWEYEDGGYGCMCIAEDELELCKGISSRYPFEYEYEPSNFDKNPNDLNEDWSDIKFDIDDFNKTNVTKENYDKVDAVADDFKTDLVGFLEKLKEELEWLPKRFRYEFLSEVICECNQDAHSIKTNSTYFANEIYDELTEKEKKKMFTTL